MERIDLRLKTEEYLRRSQMLQFFEESRAENPNPEVLIKRREQLEQSSRLSPEDIESKTLIDEVIIRLSAFADGVSTFEIFELIESDKERVFERAEIQHEIWNLVDTGILDFTQERFLKLSPGIQL